MVSFSFERLKNSETKANLERWLCQNLPVFFNCTYCLRSGCGCTHKLRSGGNFAVTALDRVLTTHLHPYYANLR